MADNPKVWAAVAIILEILITMITGPVLKNTRDSQLAMVNEFSDEFKRAESDRQTIRMETYRDFITHKDHNSDYEYFNDRITRLELRLYELSKVKP